VIVALTSPAALALKQAHVRSPIVFAFVSDPVGMGLVQSLSQPGANFTGVTYSEAGLGGKRLEVLAEALPGLSKVAVLWSRDFPDNAGLLENVVRLGPEHGIAVVSRAYRDLDDLAVAFAEVKRDGAQAAVFMTDNLMFGHRSRIAELSIVHGLATIHAFGAEAQDGGLISYGPNNPEVYVRVAAMVQRILRGARPGDLPVEQPTKFDLVINLRTAKSLGLTIPPALLLRADHVVE
jgi:putative ABC transport system substrate-binding protein